jgi:DNA-binding NtrC family response regulator
MQRPSIRITRRRRITAAVFSIDSALTTPATALVVEPSLGETMAIVAMLSSLGFRVTVSDSFQEAKTQLMMRPLLLVTELRLGEYNGLHLVLRGKAVRPDMEAIVTSHVTDTVLSAEAERLGATFVPKNVPDHELRAAICRTLFRGPGSAEPIRSPFERRKGDRRNRQSAEHDPERRVGERRRDVAALIQRAAVS